MVPVIPYSVSEGEAANNPNHPKPTLSTPIQPRATQISPIRTGPIPFFTNPQACTLSWWVGLVPQGKRKQATLQPSPIQPNSTLSIPFRAGPFPSHRKQQMINTHAEIPCLVVARGPSSHHGETKTDNAIRHSPNLSRPPRSCTDHAYPVQSQPTQTSLFPTELSTRCRRGGAEYLTGNQEGQRSKALDRAVTEPNQQ